MYRVLAAGQRSQIWLAGPGQPTPELRFETQDLLVEAPNWSLDGGSLLLNGNGLLWRLDLAAPERGLIGISFEGLPEINNDHVLDPDGEHVYLSAMDGHIYRGGLAGGPVDRVTPDDGRWHFLHGVSPDGSRLAYVEIVDLTQPGRLAVLEPHGAPRRVHTGPGHLDGPEWSPDGRWIYFNTESFSDRAGHAQLARIPDGSGPDASGPDGLGPDGLGPGGLGPGGPVEHLVATETVDWFPHLSPDARWASYVSFPAGTLGHPADLDVLVTVVATEDWSTPVRTYPLFGGQGTINVNSWSPDSTSLAFVAFPIG